MNLNGPLRSQIEPLRSQKTYDVTPPSVGGRWLRPLPFKGEPLWGPRWRQAGEYDERVFQPELDRFGAKFRSWNRVRALPRRLRGSWGWRGGWRRILLAGAAFLGLCTDWLGWAGWLAGWLTEGGKQRAGRFRTLRPRPGGCGAAANHIATHHIITSHHNTPHQITSHRIT